MLTELEQKMNELSSHIEHLLEHPEQITLDNVQKMKLPNVHVNSDLISRLKEYSDNRLNRKEK